MIGLRVNGEFDSSNVNYYSSGGIDKIARPSVELKTLKQLFGLVQ
jgi:hypothetical protein